jgi:TonB family protein
MNDGIKLINNDSYGAPELKRQYQGNTLKGLIIAVSLHIVLVTGYMIFAYISEAKSKDIPVDPNKPIIIVDISDINEPPPIDNPEIKEIVKDVKDLSALQPDPVRKDLADDVILKTQDDLNKIENNVSRDGDSTIAYFDPNNIKVDDNKIIDKINKIDKDPVPDIIYKDFEVEKPPECINLSQVKASMNYPPLAVESGQEGKVTVKVLVGKTGDVIDVGKITGPDVFFDEVRDKVTDLQFTAGLQNNTPVKVWVSVPFIFKLSNK